VKTDRVRFIGLSYPYNIRLTRLAPPRSIKLTFD